MKKLTWYVMFFLLLPCLAWGQSYYVPGAASATIPGTVELATSAETATGTDTTRAVTPAGLAALTQWDFVVIPAGSMTPSTTGGCASLAVLETAVQKLCHDYLTFDGGETVSGAEFNYVLPPSWDRSTVKAQFYWTGNTGATVGDTCEWSLQGGAFSNDDAMDAALGTAQVISDTLLAAGLADLQLSAVTPAITVGGTPALLDLVHFKVVRNSNSAGDSMAQAAKLFYVILWYKKTNTVSAP